MTTTPIRVLYIDDHALVREGLAALINRQADMHVIDEAAFGSDSIKLFRIHLPDVSLVDVRLPDVSGSRSDRQDFGREAGRATPRDLFV